MLCRPLKQTMKLTILKLYVHKTDIDILTRMIISDLVFTLQNVNLCLLFIYYLFISFNLYYI
jgi:hypothetical protein